MGASTFLGPGAMATAGIISPIDGQYKQSKRMADSVQEQARYNASIRREQANRLKSSQIAAAGSSGVRLEGSPMEMIKQTHIDSEMDAMNMIYGGEAEAANIRNRARAERNQAYMKAAMDVFSMGLSSGAIGMGKSPLGPGVSNARTPMAYNYTGGGLSGRTV